MYAVYNGYDFFKSVYYHIFTWSYLLYFSTRYEDTFGGNLSNGDIHYCLKMDAIRPYN